MSEAAGKENVAMMPSMAEEELEVTEQPQAAAPEDDPPGRAPTPPAWDPPAVDPPQEAPPQQDPPSGEPPEGDPHPSEAPVQEPPAEEVAAAGALPEELRAEEAEQQAEDAAPSEVETQKRALIEAIIYVTEEPLSAEQIAAAMGEPRELVEQLLDQLSQEYNQPHRGLTIRELAGGYKMATKAEHHEAVRTFVRNLKPPLKLSLAALETLAVIAYKQPITAPEIMDIRGVQGTGVMKTLLDRKLITTAGRKNVVGKPMLYKTTREFLIQFGLSGLAELPTLKEFEELRRMALIEPEPDLLPEGAPVEPEPEEGVPQGGNAEGDAGQTEEPAETHGG